MKMSYKNDFNVFVCGTIGSFKGIKVELNEKCKGIVKNIQSVNVLDKDHEITTMAWGDPNEMDILLGLANQTVKIYDTEFKAFTCAVDVQGGSGPICGLSRYETCLITAVESGHIKLWKFEANEGNEFETGAPIKKMRHSSHNKHLIATGGENKDLQLWNLETNQCIFTAKNVKPNTLQLRVPVWVSDIAFLPNSSQVAVCTRHGHVRLYDLNMKQRRPVINVEIHEQALTSICVAPKEKHVVVGSSTGHMMLVDLRGKGLVPKVYKGSVGSIRSVACNGSDPYIVSVGLDRHVKIHHMETNKLLYKEYLKSKLNCVLVRSEFFAQKTDEGNDSDIELINLEDDDSYEKSENDFNKLFDGMESVEEPAPKKRKEIPNV